MSDGNSSLLNLCLPSTRKDAALPGVPAEFTHLRADVDGLGFRGLLAVVRFAVKQRLKGRASDFWDFASLLELAVLAGNEAYARNLLGKALTCIREYWEPETTARNLRLVADARRERGIDVAWL
jgi:hypothetical protein